MGLFNKEKKPTLKKKASKKKTNNKTKLSKYLPTTLFIGIQEDINEKALVSYITSLAQSAFSNVREAKYSIKKLGKNRYIYEIHNGSDSLTYLPLIMAEVVQGTKNEIILKTNAQNVRVSKKTATRIETNTLIESNNREDDAVVDYETKGKMKYLVKQGSEIFIVSSLAAIVSGLVAGVSFVSKYYMLNEGFYNPEIKNIMTPHDYLQTIEKNHTHTQYVDVVRYSSKTGWSASYKEVVLEDKEEVILENKEEVVLENKEDFVLEENIVNEIDNVKNSDVNLNNVQESEVLSQPVILEPVLLDTPPFDNLEDQKLQKANLDSFEEIVEENISIDLEDVVDDSTSLKDNTPISSEQNENSKSDDEFEISEILEEVSVDIKEQNKTEDIYVQNEENEDYFEIIDAADIKSLDLSNISEENIVLE